MADLSLKIPGLRIGHYTDLKAATGCTVILCGEGAVAGVDVRGAAPGTRETDLLRPMNMVEKVHAVLLSGGSAFGLDAAGGVMRYLEEKGIGIETPGGRVPIVSAAVLFDLAIGDPGVRPGADEGYRACLAAKRGPVAEGCVGAGTGAMVGQFYGRERATKSGLGVYSITIPGGFSVFAIVAVNALGDVIDPGTGKVIAGVRRPGGQGFLRTMDLLKAGEVPGVMPGSHTVIGAVATDARLTKEQVNKVAQMAHDGLARAVNPCHTMYDGDTIFALSHGDRTAEVTAVGALAAEAFSRAAVRAVRKASSLCGVPAGHDHA
jgi:L-aminopeptidase/D-esterase-like protein